MPLGEATLGQCVPPDTQHAVSVSLPSWRSNVGYEEGQEWVTSKMTTGYPRFFIHKSIGSFSQDILGLYGPAKAEDHACMLFHSYKASQRCKSFLLNHSPESAKEYFLILNFATSSKLAVAESINVLFSALIYPKRLFPLAKSFWQHTGEGVSSRRAEYCRQLLNDGILRPLSTDQTEAQAVPTQSKGPRRYQKASEGRILLNGDHFAPCTDQIIDPPANGSQNTVEEHESKLVEERFGRNLNLALAAKAKRAIRHRIAGCVAPTVDNPSGQTDQFQDTTAENRWSERECSIDDVYLFPGGMNAIYNTHRMLMAARGSHLKSICYGFPYIDTLKVLEKFGPGCLFYGHGSAEDLDDLEKRLQQGERFLALFCECPGNPLLKTPDLKRIRALADQYDFAVVIDETIGNYLNLHVLPFADVVASSLTKIFSGDSNVLGGMTMLNPNGSYYARLKNVWAREYEDNYWPEDAIFLERNSRDFRQRTQRININGEAICDLLCTHPKVSHTVKAVYYPKTSISREFYEQVRRPDGGYGGLLSAVFFSIADATRFYDNLDTHKGPSLGTNFTLSSPFIILAHYNELEWAAKYGAEASLVRFSVGLEDTQTLVQTFQHALDAI